MRDKDAIQIVPLMIKYAAELKNKGRMLKDELENIKMSVTLMTSFSHIHLKVLKVRQNRKYYDSIQK